jgi:hypothetical protein
LAHVEKIVSRVLIRRIEKKMEDVLLENWLRFGRGYGTRDAVGMLRTLLERTMDMDEE